eukprot:11749494-Heterocapsa_arctica.AAC.1
MSLSGTCAGFRLQAPTQNMRHDTPLGCDIRRLHCDHSGLQYTNAPKHCDRTVMGATHEVVHYDSPTSDSPLIAALVATV